MTLFLLFLLAELQSVCKEYKAKAVKLEGDKYDLEYEACKRDFQVSFLSNFEHVRAFVPNFRNNHR